MEAIIYCTAATFNSYTYVHVKQQCYQFKSIRVDFLQQVLVNGKAVSSRFAIRSSIFAQHKPWITFQLSGMHGWVWKGVKNRRIQCKRRNCVYNSLPKISGANGDGQDSAWWLPYPPFFYCASCIFLGEKGYRSTQMCLYQLNLYFFWLTIYFIYVTLLSYMTLLWPSWFAYAKVTANHHCNHVGRSFTQLQDFMSTVSQNTDVE